MCVHTSVLGSIAEDTPMLPSAAPEGLPLGLPPPCPPLHPPPTREQTDIGADEAYYHVR